MMQNNEGWKIKKKIGRYENEKQQCWLHLK
jgi:hypothetical protein